MTTTLCKINRDAGLFVLHEHGRSGYSGLGFAVERERTQKLRQWLAEEGLRLPEPKAEPGTEAAWNEHWRMLRAGRIFCHRAGKRCPCELRPELIGREGCRVEVDDGDGNRRRFWISRSTGWMPCHLEMKRTDSTWGPAVCGPIKSVQVLRDDRRCRIETK